MLIRLSQKNKSYVNPASPSAFHCLRGVKNDSLHQF